MQFAHARDDGLAGLFVGANTERGVFAGEAAEGERHLFLVGLGLGFDGLRDHGLGEFHAFQNDRGADVAERVPRGDILETHRSSDVAGFGFGNFLTFVGVHLQQTADAFLLVLDRIQNGFARLQHARIDAQEGELTDIRVGHDLEGEAREGSVVARFASGFLIIEVEPRHRGDVHRRGEQFDHAVEHALHALVLERRTAEHRLNFTGDRTSAQALDDVGFGQLAVFKVGVHQLFVGFGSRFDELFVPFVGHVNEVGGNVDVVELRALAGIVPNDALHLDEVNNTLEVVLGADRHNHGNGVGLQAQLHLFDDLEEVGAGAVHLVDERDAGHLVLVGLTPNGFGLGLNAAHSAVHHHRAVEHAHRAFDFDREVHVPRGVNNIEAVGLELHVHAAPEAGGGS